MKERINIKSTDGIIRLEGDKYDSILYLNGTPIQFTWLREIGSTWRYQIAKSISENDIVEDKSFSNFVRFGYLNNDSLVVQFKYLIDKLTDGDYQLEIDYLSNELDLVEFYNEQEGYQEYDGYGGITDIISTQNTLNEQTIKEYTELISKGVQPIMVILTCYKSNNQFILDGHHKFIAYRRLKEPPRALIITKSSCTRISQQTGLSVFNIFDCHNTEYKNRFLQSAKK